MIACLSWIATSVSQIYQCPYEDSPPYSVYVLPVFLYGEEIWTMTKAMLAKVDAFNIHYNQHVTNAKVRWCKPRPLSDSPVQTHCTCCIGNGSQLSPVGRHQQTPTRHDKADNRMMLEHFVRVQQFR